MRKSIHIAILLIALDVTTAFSQSEKKRHAIEMKVRNLDSLHAAAVLSGNLKEMDKYWTEDFMVTNPFNEIDKADRIRNGSLTYSSFQRIAEAVKVHHNTVIVMGKEIVVPGGKSVDAGKTINRRYTNIWMKKKGHWRLVARHANVICPK